MHAKSSGSEKLMIEEVGLEEPVTVHNMAGLHRTFLQHLRNVDSHSVLVQGRLDEIGNLILHLGCRNGAHPVDLEGLERFVEKLTDLEASQRLMFEAGKRMYIHILAAREVMQSIGEEIRDRNSRES
jgi:hypothetical protein